MSKKNQLSSINNFEYKNYISDTLNFEAITLYYANK